MDQKTADEIIMAIAKVQRDGWRHCASWARKGMLSIFKYVESQGDMIPREGILLLLKTYFNNLKIDPPLPDINKNMAAANKSNLTYEDWIKKIRNIGTEDGDK